jgi:hypothetical protein
VDGAPTTPPAPVAPPPPPPPAAAKTTPFVLPPTNTPSQNGDVVLPADVIHPSRPDVDVDQLRTKGQALLDAIKAEQERDAPDEQKIAQLAADMLKLDRQWSSSETARKYALDDTSGDPLAGLWIPGLS